MRQRHRLYVCMLMLLLPVLLLFHPGPAGTVVHAANLQQGEYAFTVTRNVLNFVGEEDGPNPRAQRFGIINTGDEPVHWNVSVDGGAPWLSIVPTSGLGDGAVRVSVDTTTLVSGTLDLTPGTFTETLTVSAHETVAVEVITVTLVVTPTVTPIYSEDFESYASGMDPADWLDTGEDNSLVEDDLFEVFDLDGEQVFGTQSTLGNIHSHYVGAGNEAFSSYEYTGRMRLTTTWGSIGVTFFSQYPRADAYYRLRRHGHGDTFSLSAHGTSVTGGTTDTGLTPERNVWYLFRIQVEDAGTRTAIRAKIWAEGTTEPAEWQVDCYDDSPDRLAAGTIGVWSYLSGTKYWDDLVVNPLPPDESPPFAYGHDPAPGAANVGPSTDIVVHVADDNMGVYSPTLAMTVGGIPVTPVVTGDLFDYTLTYDPPADFDEGDVVTVTVDACDLAMPANCMPTEVYSFSIWSRPVIDVWYGSHQVFGHIGNPQEWVDVLGNASDPDGIDSLVYSLNGGPVLPLSVGPDNPRLVAEGDFNIEMAYADLNDGPNQVVITATDTFGNQTVETMTVEYTSGNVWPETYSIDWSSVATISDVAQIVDGLWTLEADSIRPTIIGYDRLVAIGDVDPSWDDYEVLVPITVNAAPPDPNTGGVGIIMRWQGHQGSEQPRTEWWHMGAYGYYRWRDYGPHLVLRLGRDAPIENSDVQLDVGTRYNFKMRVETMLGQGGVYSLKVWEDGHPEPAEWDLYAQDDVSDLQSGSLLLVAHRVDASFGDVTVTPGPFPDDTIPPIISDIQVLRRDTSATITWTTNEPATGSVAYGLTSAYENGSVTDSALVLQHAITLTDLISETLYHYQVTSVDSSGNVANSTDLTFKTTGDPSIFASDDFNTCSLNTGLWEFVDPLGDATLTMTGTHTEDAWLSISVPGGDQHSMSSSNRDAPRIMQLAGDTNFEIEAKFESPLTGTTQIQGVLVEQEQDERFLRFDFFSSEPDTRVFAGVYEGGSLSSQINTVITHTGVAPLYMRVRREGDWWTVAYSFDGESWTTAGSFEHVLTVNKVGVFVGNTGGNPAHTALIDYFFNSASPVVPEDGDRNTLTVNLIGNGAVTKFPDRLTYGCGEVVTLTATADPGWSFSGWGGDLSGSDNPATTVMTGSQVVTATFAQDSYVLDVYEVGEGTVTVDPDQATYVYGDVVTLTATADPGWSFGGWSGALVGSTSPATLTITGNQAVTATFTQDMYILTVHKIGKGTVVVEPDQPTYVYGDVVTLTAIADPGWGFAGWSGDLVGGANPAALTITGSQVVTATFAVSEADAYEIFLPCVARRRER